MDSAKGGQEGIARKGHREAAFKYCKWSPGKASDLAFATRGPVPWLRARDNSEDKDCFQ